MVVNQWPSNNQVETGLELRPHWLQASVLTSAVKSLLPHPCLKVNRKTSNRLSNGIQGFRLHIDHWCGIVRATRYKLKHFLCDFSQLFQIRTVFISLPLETWPTRAAQWNDLFRNSSCFGQSCCNGYINSLFVNFILIQIKTSQFIIYLELFFCIGS